MMPSLSPLAALGPVGPFASPRRRIGEWMGLWGLALFSFCALLSIAGATLGLGLMLLALILAPPDWRTLARQPLFWLSAAALAYLVARGLFAVAEFPDDVHKTIGKQTQAWAWLFLFILPGWWMSRAPRRVLLSLGLMLSGFVLGILLALDGETLQQLMQGTRSGLHFGKPIIFGFHCAVGLLAMAALIRHLLTAEIARPGIRWASVILASAALLLFFQGLILSQSRGVWLALLVALPPVLILLGRGEPRARQARTNPRILAAGGLALLLPILAMNWSTVTQRLLFENQEFGIVVSQGLGEAPLSSSTYRLHLWHFGLGKWLERPLIGWGPGTTQALIDTEDRAALKNPDSGESYDHLHNAYLEILIQLGLIGMALVLAAVLLLLRPCLGGYRDGGLSRPLFVFLIGNLVLIAVYSLTDFRHLHWNWRFYWMLLAGAIFSLRLGDFNIEETRTLPWRRSTRPRKR